MPSETTIGLKKKERDELAKRKKADEKLKNASMTWGRWLLEKTEATKRTSSA
jgi:hypothetical protein